ALLVSSLRDPTAIASSGWWTAFAHPDQWTLRNYRDVLDQQGMGRAFVNSIIIAAPATALVVLIAGAAAYAFAWMRFPFRNTLFLLVVAMLVVPLQMTLIPVLRLYVSLTLDVDIPLLCARTSRPNPHPCRSVAPAPYCRPFSCL